jgi:hypothetical protein
MRRLIQKYSTFSRHVPGPDIPEGEVVVRLALLYQTLLFNMTFRS